MVLSWIKWQLSRDLKRSAKSVKAELIFAGVSHWNPALAGEWRSAEPQEKERDNAVVLIGGLSAAGISECFCSVFCYLFSNTL